MIVMSWKEGACLSCHESRGHVCHVMEVWGMIVMSWKEGACLSCHESRGHVCASFKSVSVYFNNLSIYSTT